MEEEGKALSVVPSSGGRGLASVIDEGARERLRRVIEDGTPPNTRRAYESDLRYFWAWASAIGWTDEPVWPVPGEVVARFVADHLEGLDPEIDDDLVERGVKAKRGKLSMNTIDRRIAALSSAHRMRSMVSPTADPAVSQIMSKARKASARRGAFAKKKKAAVKSDLDLMIGTCSAGTLRDVRDEALLLFGWASGGRRRSEIVTAEAERLQGVGTDFVYHLGITKTSQEGEGGTVPLRGAAARALRRWFDASGIEDGYIFRSIDRFGRISDRALSDRSVALIVKRRARAAGLEEKLYSGHSLRSGFMTEAGLRGKNLLDAMALSGHKTVQVAAGYYQAGAALHNEASGLAE